MKPGRPILSLLVLVITVAVPPAQAATSDLTRRAVGVDPQAAELTLSPPRMVLDVTPGRAYRTFVQITNRGPSAVRLYVTTRDLVAAQQEDSFVQPRAGIPTAAGRWITPAAQQLVVAAGEQVDLPVAIRIPAGTGGGAAAAAVTVGRRLLVPAPNDDARARVAVEASLAAQLVFNVAGPATTKIDLRQLRGPRVVRTGQTSEFSVLLTNEGSTLLDTRGSIQIQPRLAGATTRNLPLRRSLVLPGGKRRARVEWNDPPAFGWFEPQIKVRANGQTVTRSFAPVLVIPSNKVLAAIAGALLLPLLVFLRRRLRARRA